MIDVGNAIRPANRVHVALQHVDDRRAALRRHNRVDVEPVDVERLVLVAIGDLLALDHQEPLVGAVERVQSVDRRQEIVIGQHEELVAVLPVPAHDIIRRRVAVAIEGVRMRVALVPAAAVSTGAVCCCSGTAVLTIVRTMVIASTSKTRIATKLMGDLGTA